MGDTTQLKLAQELPDATDKQVAEAALAGWSVRHESGRSRLGRAVTYPWLSCDAAGRAFNRYRTEREAWTACWHDLQLSLKGHYRGSNIKEPR